MRISRFLIALILAVAGIIILVIALLFRRKREPEVRDDTGGERYLGRYEVKKE
jgi:hypothetical protein